MKLFQCLIFCGIISSADGGDKYLDKLQVKVAPGESTQKECGSESEVIITCEAKTPIFTPRSVYIPETHWRYRAANEFASSASKITEESSDGKYSIVVEEYVVVRTTIKIKNASLADQGVYQCRASNSPDRNKPGLKYWTITESHVHQMKCRKGEGVGAIGKHVTRKFNRKHGYSTELNTSSGVDIEPASTTTSRASQSPESPGKLENTDGSIDTGKPLKTTTESDSTVSQQTTQASSTRRVTTRSTTTRKARRNTASQQVGGTGGGSSARPHYPLTGFIALLSIVGAMVMSR